MDPLTIVLGIGAPVLLVLFFADGLVVGKVLQPPAVFVAYVAVTDPSVEYAGIVGIGCALAATVGQWTLYRGFNDEAPEAIGIRRRIPYLDRVPTVVLDRIGQQRMGRVERYFEGYGGYAIAGSNVIPGVRCLMAVPAGLSHYPVRRFLFASTVGNLTYLGVLLGVAWGILEGVRILFHG